MLLMIIIIIFIVISIMFCMAVDVIVSGPVKVLVTRATFSVMR